MKKNKWLAAILNLLFFGGGYIYNGQRLGFGIMLVLGWAIMRAGEIQIYLTGLVTNYWIILFSGLVIMQFGFAMDAYREAKEINGEI